MNVILPIHKEYSDRIFTGIKPYEFRNRVPKLEKDDKIFVYETKKQGCGMIVGYFTVNNIEKITHHKLGAYSYLSDYAHRFCDEETQRLVDKAMKIILNDCDNSLVLCYFLMEECLDEMLKTKRPPEQSLNNLLYRNIKKYDKIQQEQHNIVSECDEWLRNMGFYNDDYGERSNWQYQIIIDKVYRYENPIPISEFKNKTGKFIQKAPQSFCYTIND